MNEVGEIRFVDEYGKHLETYEPVAIAKDKVTLLRCAKSGLRRNMRQEIEKDKKATFFQQ